MAVVERRLTVVGKGTVAIIVITIIIILGLQTLKQIPDDRSDSCNHHTSSHCMLVLHAVTDAAKSSVGLDCF